MDLHETTAKEAFSYGGRVYVRAPRPIRFPSEEPPESYVAETKRHLEARTTLYDLLKEALADDAIGSQQFVYWDAGDPQRRLSPDIFVKLGARDESFDNWKVWQRGAPDMAVEIVSDSDRGEAEWAVKLARYRASGISEVVRFDPDNERHPIRVWDRVEWELVERSLESTALCECHALGLFWVVVPSAFGPQLRLARDRDGQNLLPTPSEKLCNEERMRLLAEQKLRDEERSRLLAEQKLRDEERMRLLAEQKLREAERGRDADAAEIERLKAENARLRGPEG